MLRICKRVVKSQANKSSMSLIKVSIYMCILTCSRSSGIFIIRLLEEVLMDNWTPEQAAQELLAILPLLTRLVAAEVRREAGDETTMPQFRVLTHLAEGPLTVSGLARRRRVSLQAM